MMLVLEGGHLIRPQAEPTINRAHRRHTRLRRHFMPELLLLSPKGSVGGPAGEAQNWRALAAARRLSGKTLEKCAAALRKQL